MSAAAKAPMRLMLLQRSMLLQKSMRISSAIPSRLSRRGRRAPNQQALLNQRDEPVNDKHEYGKNDHTGKHARRVERSLGLIDEIAEPGGRAQVLAHHGTDDGKTH